MPDAFTIAEPATPPERVLWVGSSEGPEFEPCFELAARVAEIEIAEDTNEAVALLGADEPPTLVVLACPRPLTDVDGARALIDAASGVPVVQILGAWCEGEGRTGTVIEAAERVFWHQWEPWWSHRVATTPADEVGTVWVRSPDAELAEALSEALAAESLGVVWDSWDRGAGGRTLIANPGVIVWDGAQLGGRESARLAAVCAKARESRTPVIVLLDFPRTETVAAARAIGATAVLGKPFAAADLVATIQAATGRQLSTANSLVPLVAAPAAEPFRQAAA